MTQIHRISRNARLSAARTSQRTAGVPAGRGNAALPTMFMAAPRKATRDMSVRERFETMEERFIPSKAKGVNVSLQFKITGKGGGKWYIVIKDQKITVKEGTGPSPTASLEANASDYLKIANGEMSKVWAFIRGKLKVGGDKDALKEFDSYFSGNSVK